MIRTISPSEMKRVENRVMANTDITGEALMQRAAAHVADAVRLYRKQRGGLVLCVCGTGNNGGDGLAAMRMLACADPDFRGICWMLPGNLTADCRRELDRLNAEAGSRVSVRMLGAGESAELPKKLDCVIDALFGTGLARPLDGLAKALCEAINACDAPVVAVDIPSGLHGETGEVMGAAIKADCTVTFHRPKPGLYLKQGPDHAGSIIVADIGLHVPKAAALDDAAGMHVLEKKDLKWLLPARKKVSHKGSYGRVLLFAGSRGMAGAAGISALAALRAGAGLVTVACPESVVDIVQVLCPCATCLPLSAEAEEAWPLLKEALGRADAVGAGCGLGQGPWTAVMTAKLTEWLSENAKPAVLDADALNLIARADIKMLGANTLITPHPAEAARLMHTDIPAVLEDAPAAAQKLCGEYGASVVLKGTCSVLCAEAGMAINPFGTPGMAKGGSGDALTGITAALLAGRAAGAYIMNDLQLLQTACALHGLAGEMAAQRFGERGMLATDLCECIGLVQCDEEKQEEETAHSLVRRSVTVIVERTAGSRDEEDRQKIYRLNCGYVQQVLDEQNEWQDACILGCKEPLEWFDGEVKAEVDVNGQTFWAVALADEIITEEEIQKEMAFLGEVRHIEMF